MVDTGSVEAVLKSPGTRGFDLAEFPPLGDGQIGVTVAGGNAIDSGKSVWNLLDQSLQFFPPVTTNGRARVQPPKEVLSNGAKQWDNTLVGNFLGKSPNLSVFQKTVDRLWGRESSVQICFLAPSVYMINFPSRRENCDAKMDDGRATNGDAKVGLSCDAEGESLESPNKFELLCSVVEGQDDRMVSPRKEVKESKGPKKKSQGKGSQKVKVNKEMWSEN
ncbi:hypothetical protein V6N12_007022 [Hibiscus sabdariffa]|uniref:DUF4283 domain-containing protein n=1 Tax=Hibiscus sabdariffa TaxID=183260 RepID=A0ABR2F0I3_9ROSI